jgi:hypothetical protein
MPISRQARMMRTGDLAAVGDQDAFEHDVSAPLRRFDAEERLTVLDGLGVLHQVSTIFPRTSALISLMTFMASMMQTVVSGSIIWPSVT